MMKYNYKLGDWLENTRTKEVYEIVKIYNNFDYSGCYIEKRFDTRQKGILKWHHSMYKYFSELDAEYILAPTAQVLYSKNSNKGSQDENNEK